MWEKVRQTEHVLSSLIGSDDARCHERLEEANALQEIGGMVVSCRERGVLSIMCSEFSLAVRRVNTIFDANKSVEYNHYAEH